MQSHYLRLGDESGGEGENEVEGEVGDLLNRFLTRALSASLERNLCSLDAAVDRCVATAMQSNHKASEGSSAVPSRLLPVQSSLERVLRHLGHCQTVGWNTVLHRQAHYVPCSLIPLWSPNESLVEGTAGGDRSSVLDPRHQSQTQQLPPACVLSQENLIFQHRYMSSPTAITPLPPHHHHPSQ